MKPKPYSPDPRGHRMPRFFIPPSAIAGDMLTLDGEVAHQVRNVLRMRAGERVVLLDNSGQEFVVELGETAGREIEGRVLESRPSPSEPHVRLTLYPALLKGDKFEWLLQKGTELGIAAFQPVLCERSVSTGAGEQKGDRWQRIIREAAEQSARGIVPSLGAAIPFAHALAKIESDALSLIPYEAEHALSLRAALSAQPIATRVNLWIGPEGGFTPEEIASAQARGAIAVTLGPRILRAETASLAAAAAVMYALGEMG
jgi:16S rRNA (uracil1498-N3)-methyltransferase